MTSAHPNVLTPDRASGDDTVCATGTPPLNGRDAQLAKCVSQLRARIGQNDPDGSSQALLSEFSDAVEGLRGERDGMAEELLGVYEQLGVIFEVTSRLPTVCGEPEVLDLFMDALQRSFLHYDVFFLPPNAKQRGVRATDSDRGGVASSIQAGGGAEEWQHALMDSLRDQRRTVVETPPKVKGLPYFREILFGPIFAGASSSNEALESFVGAVSIARRREGRPFRASDMLLVESLTTFCGDLIRNHRLVRELGETSVAMVQALVNAVDQKDPYTSGHSLRVGYYSTLLGKRIGLPDADLQMLQWSALLHDVGKIGIRDEVLKNRDASPRRNSTTSKSIRCAVIRWFEKSHNSQPRWTVFFIIMSTSTAGVIPLVWRAKIFRCRPASFKSPTCLMRLPPPAPIAPRMTGARRWRL